MISIVIPVFNSMDTLDEAFQSARTSGIADQEIILVDDGSTDGSWDAIRRYAAQYPNVVALRHESNRGGGAARNAGIRAARHDLLFVLDSDDLLAGNGALLRAVELLTSRPALDGVATGRSEFFETNPAALIRTVRYKPGPTSFPDLFKGPSPVLGNLLFRRSIYDKVGGYPSHHGFDTQAFGSRLLANLAAIEVLDDVIYHQRLPRKPSYYVRESRAGNIGRNSYFVVEEAVYKFRPQVRSLVAGFHYADPRALARGETIWNRLATMAGQEDIFDEEGLRLDDRGAYALHSASPDPILQSWCAGFELRWNDLAGLADRLDRLRGTPSAVRILYPLLARASAQSLSRRQLYEIRYFFAADKGGAWWLGHTLQRVFNRLRRLQS